jgi:opacity protein-like surface antigen
MKQHRLCLQRHLLLGLLSASILLGTAAHAQDRSFEGFSLGLNLALQSDSTELTAGSTRLHGLGWTSQSAGLQAAYGWSAGDSTLLSVGASYTLGDTIAPAL